MSIKQTACLTISEHVSTLIVNIYVLNETIFHPYLLWYIFFFFIEKSDVSKIWKGQKSGEDANETKVH